MTESARRLKVYTGESKSDPKEYAKFLSSACYQKRNQVDPYMIEAVIGGVY